MAHAQKPFLFHPTFYCALHGIELALKSHLAAAGYGKSRLATKAFGHNLAFALLGTQMERDLLSILRNFAHYARSQKLKDFPFPLQHVAERLGVSFQYVSKLRQRLTDSSLLHRLNRRLLIAQQLGLSGLSKADRWRIWH